MRIWFSSLAAALIIASPLPSALIIIAAASILSLLTTLIVALIVSCLTGETSARRAEAECLGDVHTHSEAARPLSEVARY